MYTDDINVYFDMVKEIKKQNIDDILLHCIFCVKCKCASDKEQKIIFDMAKFTMQVWLKSDIDLSIPRIADIVVEEWDTIQEEEMIASEFISAYGDILYN